MSDRSYLCKRKIIAFQFYHADSLEFVDLYISTCLHSLYHFISINKLNMMHNQSCDYLLAVGETELHGEGDCILAGLIKDCRRSN